MANTCLLLFTFATPFPDPEYFTQMTGTGGSGHLNCSVQGGRGGGMTLSWQHEGRPLHAPHPRLAVGPVRPHHAGFYQCTAQDHSDTAVSGAELVIAGNLRVENSLECKPAILHSLPFYSSFSGTKR